MKTNISRNRSAFTLVEIMIVVAIIGLLAVIAVPGFIRSRQLAQGRSILNNARQVDAAIDQWALENGKTTGNSVDSAGIAAYLKEGKLKTQVTNVGSAGGDVSDVVLTGVKELTIGNVGSTQVIVHSDAKTALPAMTDWGNY